MLYSNNLPPLVWKSSFLYDQGPNALKMQFTIICQNIPVNSYVSFSSDELGPSPAIELKPTVVNDESYFTAGMASDIPADYTGTITFCLYSSDKMPAKSQAELQVGYLEGALTGMSPQAITVVKAVTTENA